MYIICTAKNVLTGARACGCKGGRPRKMDVATLSMPMAVKSDPKAVAKDVAKRLGITTASLYMYVNGDGTAKEKGKALLEAKK